MRRYFIYIGLLLISFYTTSNGQFIYYSSAEDLQGDSIKTNIGLLNLETCSSQILFIDTAMFSSGYGFWGDIAYCPDGVLYGLGSDGIYLIDLINKTHLKIMDKPSPPVQRWFKGMTCTKDTILIFGERDILSFDINAQSLIHHGRVPASLSIWANLFWHKGLLMGSASDQIIQVDLLNPANSLVYCDLPTTGFLSITEVAVSCDSVAVFGFHISGDVYVIDPLDCSMTYHCSISKGPDETFQGSSPSFMFMPPDPCEIHLDLDQYDMTLPGIHYQDTIFCSLPVTLLHAELELFSDKPWDSLLVWIEKGPPGIYLEGSIPSFATLTGQNSNQLGYYSTSDVDLRELSPFLNDIILTGQIPDGINTLKIGFRAWADYLVSDTAYAYITLRGRTTTAGDNATFSLCLSDPPLDVLSLLSDDATAGGTWIPSLSQLGYFQPGIDAAGSYLYIVSDPLCDPDTASFGIVIFNRPAFDLGPDVFLCPGDTFQIRVNLGDVSFLWSNGSTTSALDIFEPQLIWLKITDAFGCLSYDTLQILLDEACIKDKIYIPNIFSPDGNGINDEWAILSHPAILYIDATIFDRWGNALFNQKGASIQWNGNTKDGQLLASGTYVYRVVFRTVNQTEFIRTGDITLLR